MIAASGSSVGAILTTIKEIGNSESLSKAGMSFTVKRPIDRKYSHIGGVWKVTLNTSGWGQRCMSLTKREQSPISSSALMRSTASITVAREVKHSARGFQ